MLPQSQFSGGVSFRHSVQISRVQCAVPSVQFAMCSVQCSAVYSVQISTPVCIMQCAQIQATAQMFGHFPMKDEKELRPQLNYQTMMFVGNILQDWFNKIHFCKLGLNEMFSASFCSKKSHLSVWIDWWSMFSIEMKLEKYFDRKIISFDAAKCIVLNSADQFLFKMQYFQYFVNWLKFSSTFKALANLFYGLKRLIFNFHTFWCNNKLASKLVWKANS